MRSIYKNTGLIAAVILVISIPSAFATTVSYTTYTCPSVSTISTLDIAKCGTGGDAQSYSNPDGTNIGNAKVWMYNTAPITAPDTATLSGLSAYIYNGGSLYVASGGTYADANIEAWISDPSCSPAYLCALSGVYSPIYSHSITSGSYSIPVGTQSGPNRNYGISTTATYDIVGYVETNASPGSCTQCNAQMYDSIYWGITNMKITLTY